jgi:hypothetical protein
VNEVEIFFQKYILTLQPNGEPLTFAFFFIFWGYVCCSILQYFKRIADFDECLGFAEWGKGAQHSCFSS